MTIRGATYTIVLWEKGKYDFMYNFTVLNAKWLTRVDSYDRILTQWVINVDSTTNHISRNSKVTTCVFVYLGMKEHKFSVLELVQLFCNWVWPEMAIFHPALLVYNIHIYSIILYLHPLTRATNFPELTSKEIFIRCHARYQLTYNLVQFSWVIYSQTRSARENLWILTLVKIYDCTVIHGNLQ